MQLRHTSRTRTRRSAFTLVELLVSIMVIGILLGMLIIGARVAIRFVRTQADRQAVISMRIGIIQFKQDHGIPMPLVRDQHFRGATPEMARVELTGNAGNYNRIAVYDISAPTPVGDDYKAVLIKRLGSGTAAPSGWGALTEYYDTRWSNNSLAYYLVGALEEKLNSPNADLVIDGKTGHGMFAANRDGSFKIPSELALDPLAKMALPRIYDPYFVPNSSSTKIWVDPSGLPGAAQNVQIRDRNQVPFRYYHWLHDEGFRTDPVINNYLRVPLVVGDPTTDTRLRSATFAVVGAGPDGVFGDEPIDALRIALGMADASELIARKKAMEDNVVEFGD